MEDHVRATGLHGVEDVTEIAEVPTDDFHLRGDVVEELGGRIHIKEYEVFLPLLDKQARDLGTDESRPSSNQSAHNEPLIAQRPST
jgi:hypothetical protein